MIKTIAYQTGSYLKQEGILKENQREVFEYGLEIFISNIQNIMIIMSISYILKCSTEAIIFMSFFTLLRINSGGFHASTHGRCLLSYMCMLFGAILISKGIYLMDITTVKLIQVLTIIVTIINIFILAPQDTENKRLNNNEKLKFKRRSRYIISAQSILIVLIMFIDLRVSFIAIEGIFFQSLTLIPNLKKREE